MFCHSEFAIMLFLFTLFALYTSSHIGHYDGVVIWISSREGILDNLPAMSQSRAVLKCFECCCADMQHEFSRQLLSHVSPRIALRMPRPHREFWLHDTTSNNFAVQQQILAWLHQVAICTSSQTKHSYRVCYKLLLWLFRVCVLRILLTLSPAAITRCGVISRSGLNLIYRHAVVRIVGSSEPGLPPASRFSASYFVHLISQKI